MESEKTKEVKTPQDILNERELKRRETHRKIYEKPVSESVETKVIYQADGTVKKKFVKYKKYSDGVIKSELIGMEKNGEMIFGVKQ